MKKVLFSPQEVVAKIKAHEKLLLAGDENLLATLPAGNWIAGTIPYFMAEDGGVSTKEKIFVTELPNYVTKVEIKKYDKESLKNIYNDAPENGFSIIILPAASEVLFEFALNSQRYENFATRALVGWVSGVFLDDIGKNEPKVFAGIKSATNNGAMVMHAHLPPTKIANVGIINIFEPSDGDTFEFLNDGFDAKFALINGQKQDLVNYMQEKNVSTQLPLVANYNGVMVNASFLATQDSSNRVKFYAPVFRGIEYRQAKPISNYVSEFSNQIKKTSSESIVFSCNCILNYLYSKLEGQRTAGISGPITFGEVAYRLLNQTMVYLTIDELGKS